MTDKTILKNLLLFFLIFSTLGCVQINIQKTPEPQYIAETKEKENIDSISLIFLGDIMGHDAQIEAAYDSASSSYNYHSVFETISPLLKSADYTIGNLEVTLAGRPYKGYPQFSSPNALAVACKNNGINVLVTANNHSNDRKKYGVIRTLDVLDSLHINHTGTFRDSIERANTNLLVLVKNTIRIGVLNYTYGSNNKSSTSPAIINKIDTSLMLLDINASKKDSLDKLIIMLHWGKEYKPLPNKFQKSIANFLFNNGVDIVIGAHPHVIQPMVYQAKTDTSKERFIAYSLGNFVSNQRKRYSDGGALVEISLIKKEGKTHIDKKGYHLAWVKKLSANKKLSYEIILAGSDAQMDLTPSDSLKMALFLDDSRNLLLKENRGVPESANTFKE